MTFISNPGTGSLSPVFDYSSRDYVSVYTDLLNRIPIYLPEWTSRSPNDFGIALLGLYAYAIDTLHYYIDRLAGEAFLQTATQPQSIINLATMLDYTPTLSSGSAVVLSITISSNMVLGNYPVVIPAGTVFSTVATSTGAAIPFVTTEQISIPGPTGATPSFVGTVQAEQGIQYNEAVATSDGTINQTYPLMNNPVSADSLTVEVDLGNGPQPWNFVQSLIDSGPNDAVFTDFVDANGVFYIVFGDGVNGLIPSLGSPITATYMTNVGDQGNVGPNTITIFVGPPTGSSPIVGIQAVTNPLAASGGAAAESIASIQVNAPASLRALNRGVTVSDISALAQAIAGVQWASAVQLTYQLVNLFIVPNGGGSVSSLLSTQISDAMVQSVMGNTTVTVLSANYIAIDITVTVQVFENFSNSVVQQAVVNALNNMLALANTGFGFRVALGLVYETILDVPGVNYAFVTELSREVFVTLLTAINNSSINSSLSVTDVPQQIDAGDVLILSNGSSTQTVTASQSVSPGANVIPVFTFTANATYQIGSTVQDTSLLTDAVTLPDEVPVAGVMTVTANGGIPT